MKYQRFEALVLIVGVATVVGSVLFSYGGTLVPEEIAAQLLLLAVLFSALHWGRTGGFAAAVITTLAYIALRIPLVIEEGLTAEVSSLILVRVLTYGLIGIVGGELCMRIKYVFARLEGTSTIDEWTHIYNQRHVVGALEKASAQFVRYDTPYSVVLITLSPKLTSALRPSKQRAIARSAAKFIRGDIRLVDEAARLEDGRFCVLLPHTGRTGASVAADRLGTGLRKVLGAKDESVVLTTLGTPDDAAQLVELRSQLLATLPADPPGAASPLDE